MKVLFLTGVVCMLLSCKPNHSISEDSDLIFVPEKQTDDLWIKNNLELDMVVPIETTNNYLLGEIKRVIFYKDKLIILDRIWPSIFVVNAYTGKIETHINNVGKGPGESRSIRDIAFDDKRENILVFNDYEKLVYFSLDGRFLKEENIGNLFENILYDNDHVIFYNAAVGYSCFPYSLSIYDLTDKSWKKLGKEKKIDFHMRGGGRLLVKSKNIWFTPVLDHGLHKLNGDTIEVPYILDVKNKLHDQLKEKSISDFKFFVQEVLHKNILYSLQSIRETEKFLIFSSNLPGFMMMDKKTLELHWTWWMKDGYLGINLENYFPHDGNDNRVMFIIEANKWLEEYSPQNMDDIPEHLRKKINDVKVKEESNPILIFYKEK